jgi:hypothetical protein
MIVVVSSEFWDSLKWCSERVYCSRCNALVVVLFVDIAHGNWDENETCAFFEQRLHSVEVLTESQGGWADNVDVTLIPAFFECQCIVITVSSHHIRNVEFGLQNFVSR